MTADFLSFHLKDEFVDQYRTRSPKLGFPMGEGTPSGAQLDHQVRTSQA